MNEGEVLVCRFILGKTHSNYINGITVIKIDKPRPYSLLVRPSSYLWSFFPEHEFIKSPTPTIICDPTEFYKLIP